MRGRQRKRLAWDVMLCIAVFIMRTGAPDQPQFYLLGKRRLGGEAERPTRSSIDPVRISQHDRSSRLRDTVYASTITSVMF